MTNDVNDVGSEVEPDLEMEIAGPPARRHDLASSRLRRTLVVATMLALLIVGFIFIGSRSPFDDPAARTPRDDTTPTAPAAAASATDLLDDLPQGLPPAIPHLRGGMLHVGGARIRTTANRLLAASGTVLVGRSGDDPVQWWTLDGVDLAPMPELEGVFTPSLSPRGDLVAWTSYPDRQTTRITVLRLETRAEVDHVDLPAPYVECCGGGQDVEIRGFDLRDQLYWSDGRGMQVWRPGSGAPHQRVSGGGTLLQVAPAGPVRQGGSLGRVDARGHWSKLGDLPTDQGLAWSGDGRLAAYGGDDTGLVAVKQAPTDEWVLDPATAARTRLAVPDGVPSELIGFESDDAILVDAIARPRRHYLLRCSVSDGACERTAPPGRPTWVFPEHSTF